MATKRKSQRIYTVSDVETHSSTASLWVIREGKIYDLTTFVADHPGGDDLILRYAGKDVKGAMEDAGEHIHSDSAYHLLDDFQIGRLGSEESIVDENIKIDDDFEPQETDVSEDYKRNQFLDLDRPLIMQIWYSNFSKSFYLQQVHQPRHLPGPARLFGPWYLEIFTRNPWYMVPIIWLPITINLFYLSVVRQPKTVGWTQSNAVMATTMCFLAGNVIWTILEYTLHRFLFHIDYYLPDHPAALTLHFLFHGIHHNIPMDRLRLVMPATLFAALQFPFTQLAYKLFPNWMANGIISGAFMFYILYDTMHYALHHTKLPAYIKAQKIYHMEHHFKNYEAGYGVTSPIWDYVFGTTFDDASTAKAKANSAQTQ